MTTLIVSIVSDQTIPNIEFINIHKENNVEYVFITTDYSEKKHKTRDICNVCELNENDSKFVHKINLGELSECSIQTIQRDLENYFKEKLKDETYENILVNATGGNKIMFYAVVDFFSRKNESKIYYTDVTDKDFFRNLFDNTDKIDKLNSLTPREYLTAYGHNNIEIDNEEDFHEESLSANLFNFHSNILPQSDDINFKNINEFMRFINDDFSNKNKESSSKDKKSKRLAIDRNPQIFIDFNEKEAQTLTKEALSEHFKNISFKLKESNKISLSERRFFNGTWFEEYVYFLLKDYIRDIGGEINKGILINTKDKNESKPENELDIAIIYKNRLYVIENKFTVEGNFNDYIYKIQAIKKEFGLTPVSILATFDEKIDIESKKTQKKRLKSFDIHLFTREDFVSKEVLIDRFNNEIFKR